MSVSVFGMVLFFQIGTAWANALGAVCLFWVVCCTIAIPVIVILDDESQ